MVRERDEDARLECHRCGLTVLRHSRATQQRGSHELRSPAPAQVQHQRDQRQNDEPEGDDAKKAIGARNLLDVRAVGERGDRRASTRGRGSTPQAPPRPLQAALWPRRRRATRQAARRCTGRDHEQRLAGLHPRECTEPRDHLDVGSRGSECDGVRPGADADRDRRQSIVRARDFARGANVRRPIHIKHARDSPDRRSAPRTTDASVPASEVSEAIVADRGTIEEPRAPGRHTLDVGAVRHEGLLRAARNQRRPKDGGERKRGDSGETAGIRRGARRRRAPRRRTSEAERPYGLQDDEGVVGNCS